jgi:hypothetical protein
MLASAPVSVFAKPAKAPPVAPLTERGEALSAKYAAELDAARKGILAAVPKIVDAKKTAYITAKAAEEAAETRVNAAKAARGKVAAAEGLVGHAKGKWIGGADKGIAEAQAKLKAATTPADREAAEKALATWQKNREEGVQALAERQAALDKAKADEPAMKKELADAEAAFAKAKSNMLDALAALDIEKFLASDKLDGVLAKFMVLHEATPRGLAAFAEKGEENAALVDALLGDASLMKEMVVNDGAAGGKYGQAMKIYTDILKASPDAKEGVLHQLALAIALEHAEPLKQTNPAAVTDGPTTVNPVTRYKEFEKAYLAGELDPAFKKFSAWDLRFVVDGDEPEGAMAWGREMLRNYRPDQVTMADYRWRYVESVRTEVRYGSQDVKCDLPELFSYQNMIMNGGICGRRAFFGRYILRSFGIPTTARPQKGHAALCHWTPDGWVVNLGAGWGHGWTKTRYASDLDFLATTQARNVMSSYMEVKRAQWIGSAMGQTPVYGLLAKGTPGFWYGIALDRQQQIIRDSEAKVLAAVGEDIGEANESKTPEVVKAATITDADRKISIGSDGTITIPAAATSKPANSTGKIRFVPSFLGGMQMHYGRNGGPETFEYTFDAPAAGTYGLTARVVTTSPNQHFHVVANDSGEPVDIAVPHTVGAWSKTPVAKVTLVKGKNVLRFSHSSTGEPKGVSIKDFTLVPVQ